MEKIHSTRSFRKGPTSLGLPFTCADFDRRGNARYYFRRKGEQKIRLKSKPFDEYGIRTDEITAEHRSYLAGEKTNETPSNSTIKTGSMQWLMEQYYLSPDFRSNKPKTQSDKRLVLGKFLELCADVDFRYLKRRHVQQHQLSMAATPGAADKYVKYLRRVFFWAIEQEMTQFNPAAKIPKINKSNGLPTWTTELIQTYRNFFPLDHKARLAFEILLNTGARISDATKLSKRSFRDGRIEFLPIKTEGNLSSFVSLPVTEALSEVLKHHPLDGSTLIVTDYGKPYTTDGFGNRMRKWCDEAGVPNHSSHGLRKAAATALAEAGASERELRAVFGWTDSKTAETYVEAASKKRLSDNAYARLSNGNITKSVPLFGEQTSHGTKTGKNDDKSIPVLTLSRDR